MNTILDRIHGNIVKLTHADAADLALSSATAVKFFIDNYAVILRISEHFNNGYPDRAFADILERGLRELDDLCDLDDDMTENENYEKI